MSDWNWNLSYSAYSLWKQSPLLFLYTYILKLPPENSVSQIYGSVGNYLHYLCEEYIKGNVVDFDSSWDNWKDGVLNKDVGLNGKLLNRDNYKTMFATAKQFIDTTLQKDKCITEERLEFRRPEYDNILIKGFIDVVQKTDDGRIILVDWKTNSRSDYMMHKSQRLFYSWLYYKVYGVIPDECKWIYLKKGTSYNDVFTQSDVDTFDNEIKSFIKEIQVKGTNEFDYDVGDFDNPFNAFQGRCRQMADIRKENNIIAVRQTNKLIFQTELPYTLHKVIDKYFSYKKEYWLHEVDKKTGEKTGKKLRKEYPVKFLKNNTLPFGFISEFERVLIKYNERAGTSFKLVVIDKRDQNVVNAKYQTEFADSDIDLRYYQNDCLDIMDVKSPMIVYGGTGFGKSILAGEFIKRMNKRTLVVINKIELVHQLAEDFSDYLGVEVGEMLEGNIVIDKQIIVASISTIIAILKRENEDSDKLRMYLYNVGVVVYDECHGVKDDSMYSKLADELVNISHCVGLTGSPFRSDNNLEMNTLVGYVEYTKTTKELEDEGFLCPTKVMFMDMEEPIGVEKTEKYHENYKNFIVNHDKRNELIIKIANKYRDNKKIIVLVQSLEHGKILNEMIDNSFFLHGSVPKEKRREKYQEFKKEGGFVLIGMVSIVSTGLNIVDLDMMINACGFGSDIYSIQSSGRLKRKIEGKQFGYFFDIYDKGLFEASARKRMKILKEFGNEVKRVRL